MQTEKIDRISVAEMDEILGHKFPVLDDGFIRLIDYMGTDSAITQAARISYGKGTKTVSEDRGLIRYLMRHRHTTPFEMCEIKLHIRIPMDCHRQLVRHRTASINEYSTRYSEAIDACQKTAEGEWRSQSGRNKQGSVGFVDEWASNMEWPDLIGPDDNPQKHLTEVEAQFHVRAREIYQERLSFGVAREQARKDLPLSNYTELYWKIDLHNLFHFLSLRMDSHAQKEIRDYANIIGNEIVSKWCPLAWSAFKDYRLDAMFLTLADKEMIRALSSYGADSARQFASTLGWLDRRGDGTLKNNRERTECEAKLAALGMLAPWL